MDYIKLDNIISDIIKEKLSVPPPSSPINTIKIYGSNKDEFLGFYTKLEFIRPFVEDVIKNQGDMGLEALRLGGATEIAKQIGEMAGAFSEGTDVFDTLKKMGGTFTDANESFGKIASAFKTNDTIFEKIMSTPDAITDIISSVIGGTILSPLLDVKTATSTKTVKTIILPLPNDVPSDTVSVEWKEEEMGLLGELFNKRQSTGNSKANVIMSQVVDKLYNGILGENSDNLIGGMNVFLKTAQKLRSAQKGIRLGGDSDMLIFSGLKRRNVALEWNFIPNTQEQMKNILSICNECKRLTLPSNVANDYGTVYPSYVRLSIYLGEKLYYHIYEGVIESFEFVPVQANNGIWRYDGKPAEINLKLSIKDRRRMYAEDYGYDGISDIDGEVKINPKSLGTRDDISPITFYSQFIK